MCVLTVQLPASVAVLLPNTGKQGQASLTGCAQPGAAEAGLPAGFLREQLASKQSCHEEHSYDYAQPRPSKGNRFPASP